MPNYFYTDANGQTQGPVNEQQLQTLVTQKIIVPDTPLETDSGHKGLAGQIPGLFTVAPNPFVQTPTEHKNYCYNCGAGVNPQQVVCIKCGSAVGVTGQETDFIDDGSTNNGLMWMHLTWFFCPLITLIIWIAISGKNPKARIHGKNILNALLTAFFNNFIYVGLIVIFCLVTIGLARFEDETYDYFTIPLAIGAGVLTAIFILFALYVLVIRPVITSVQNGIAAGKGEVQAYKWANRFLKT